MRFRRLHDWWIESDIREVIFGYVPESWVRWVEDRLFGTV